MSNRSKLPEIKKLAATDDTKRFKVWQKWVLWQLSAESKEHFVLNDSEEREGATPGEKKGKNGKKPEKGLKETKKEEELEESRRKERENSKRVSCLLIGWVEDELMEDMMGLSSPREQWLHLERRFIGRHNKSVYDVNELSKMKRIANYSLKDLGVQKFLKDLRKCVLKVHPTLKTQLCSPMLTLILLLSLLQYSVC